MFTMGKCRPYEAPVLDRKVVKLHVYLGFCGQMVIAQLLDKIATAY